MARALTEATEQRGVLRGEYDRLNNSIKAMEAATDGTCCPTCSTALTDPTIVVAALTTALGTAIADGKVATARVTTLEQQVNLLRQQTQDAATAQADARHATDQAATAARTATDAERDATEITDAARISHTAAEDAKHAALSAAQQTHTLSAAVDHASNALRVAQIAAAAAARIPALSQDAATSRQAATDAAAVLTAARDHLVSVRVDPAEQERVTTTFRDTQRLVYEAEQAKTEAHGHFRVAEEQTKSAEKTRDAEELRMRARAEAYVLLEQKTAVREALDFFRKDRIASLAPELSEIATDHITKMTDGKFVAIELDEEFTPVITDQHGQMRPASWLSGGEESAVALALRLAIGEVIAGQQGGLLWMDEPQTAMDASRRPAMMAVIRDLPGRQPIIISHVSEAADMVDLVLEVVPNEETGSTVLSSPTAGGVEDPALLDAIT